MRSVSSMFPRGIKCRFITVLYIEHVGCDRSQRHCVRKVCVAEIALLRAQILFQACWATDIDLHIRSTFSRCRDIFPRLRWIWWRGTAARCHAANGGRI